MLHVMVKIHDEAENSIMDLFSIILFSTKTCNNKIHTGVGILLYDVKGWQKPLFEIFQW